MFKFILYGEIIQFGRDIELRKKANKLIINAQIRLLKNISNLMQDYDLKNPAVAYKVLRPSFYNWIEECLDDIRRFALENNRPYSEAELQTTFNMSAVKVEMQLWDFEWDYEILRNMKCANKIPYNARNISTFALKKQSIDESQQEIEERENELREAFANCSEEEFFELMIALLSEPLKELITRPAILEELDDIYNLGINSALKIIYRKDANIDLYDATELAKELNNNRVSLDTIMHNLPELIRSLPFCEALFTQEIMDNLVEENDRKNYYQIARFLEMDQNLEY